MLLHVADYLGGGNSGRFVDCKDAFVDLLG